MSAGNDEFYNKPYESTPLDTNNKIKESLTLALEKSARKWVYISTLWGKRKLYVVNTVGFHLLGLPELVIMGNSELTCEGYLDLFSLAQYAQNKKSDHFGIMEHALMPFPAMILDVGPKSKSRFLRKLCIFYEGWDFDAQQMVVPDEKRRYPWEKDFNEKYRLYQFPLIV